MFNHNRFLTFVVSLVLAFTVGIASGAEPELRAGAAQERITPPMGMPMAGYYSERLATGVHDDLFAKALYLSDGKTEIAWVVCDIIGLSRQVVADARRRIREQTGLATDHVLLSATHSHTGPLYSGPMPGVYEENRAKLSPMQQRYNDDLIASITRAVVRAREQARPARLEVGIAQEPSISFNRRFHMKNGEVRFNPGKRNPDIVRPAGPNDPRVAVLHIRDGKKDAPLATVVNFALHLDTVGGTSFSADYPFFLGQRLRSSFGQDYVPIFAQGCCGDINHVDVSTTAPQKGFAEAERIGNRLADAAFLALKKPRAIAEPRLGAASALVALPLQMYSPDAITSARKTLEKEKRLFLEEVHAHKVVKVAQIGKPALETEVQVLRIGDVAVVGLPGEVFVELGLWVREKSPFPLTIVSELANDSIGYVPTRKACKEGSYEVVNSLIAPGGGEQLAEKAVELLNGLK